MAQQNPESLSLKPTELEKDEDKFTALLQMKDYKPQREEYSIDIAREIVENLRKNHERLKAADTEFNAATDALRAEEWRAHHFMQGATEQVIGQFTTNSDEYASLGYKKKMDYKRPARKKKD